MAHVVIVHEASAVVAMCPRQYALCPVRHFADAEVLMQIIFQQLVRKKPINFEELLAASNSTICPE